MVEDNAEPIFINGVKILTAVEDGTHIIDPVFQEEHKLGRIGIRIKIDIENKLLLKGLMVLGGEKWNFLHESPEKKFEKVVLALGELQSATGAWKGKPAINPIKSAGRQELIDFGVSAKKGFNKQLGGRTLLKPLMDVADFVGVVPEVEIAGKGVPSAPRKKTQLQKEFDVFEENEKIKEWRTNVVGASYDKELARKLHTALYLFDMSPEDFLKGNYQHKELVEDRFTWIQDSGKASTQAEWIFWIEKLVGYGKQNQKFKTWMNSEGTTVNLIEFANELNPDVFAGNNDMTNQGEKIRSKISAQFKGGGGREKSLKEAIKHFLVAHDKITGGVYPEGRWFYIGAPILQYADLHMEDKEIMAMYEQLKKPELNFTETKATVHEDAEKWLKHMKKRRKNPYYAQPFKINKKGKKVENTKYTSQKAEYEYRKKMEGKKKTKDWKTSKEDWEDAYHYFLYAVEIGWRANEAFTCGTSTEIEDFNAKKKSAILFPKSSKPFMIVKFLTRKTWGISDRRPDVDRYTATVDVFDTDVIDAVKERQAQIKAGLDSGIESQSELYTKYGIITKYDVQVQETDERTGKKKMVTKQKSNNVHALIGKDGKYIQLGTMELQSSEDMTTLEKKELEARGQRSQIMRTTDAPERLRAIMRVCYERVMPEKHGMQKYWTSNSLHSLRHVFAQAWLARSKFDFKWVSERGHWGGIAILEQAYGKPTAKLQLIKTAKYSETTLAQAEQQAQSKAQEKTAEESTGVTDPKVMAMLEKLTEKMMNTKFETTKEYAEKHPEQVEGAEKVEGVAEPEPESESEGEDEPEGVREA